MKIGIQWVDKGTKKPGKDYTVDILNVKGLLLKTSAFYVSTVV